MQNDFIRNFWGIFKNETAGVAQKDIIALLVVEALAVAALVIAFRKKGRVTVRKVLYTLAVLTYTYILLQITLFRREPGSRAGIVHLKIMLGFGFRTGNPSWIMVFSLLNILLFVPFGILIYLFFRKSKTGFAIFATTLTGLLMSSVIECAQFLTGRGMFEVTDLVTNTTGALVGALVAALLYKKIFKALRKQS